MSVPARDLPARDLPVSEPPRRRPPRTTVPARPGRPAPPARLPAARPRRFTPPRVSRRARRGHHPVFWCFTAAVVSLLVFGLVALNTLQVQTTYRIQGVQQDVGDLADHQAVLSKEAAALSSPERVAAWAASQGMAMPRPGDTVILRVPGVAAVAGGDAG